VHLHHSFTLPFQHLFDLIHRNAKVEHCKFSWVDDAAVVRKHTSAARIAIHPRGQRRSMNANIVSIWKLILIVSVIVNVGVYNVGVYSS
jgi:hypothetical protein